MNIKAKITALCLAAALLTSMLSGCGAERVENPSQSGQTAAVQSLTAGACPLPTYPLMRLILPPWPGAMRRA